MPREYGTGTMWISPRECCGWVPYDRAKSPLESRKRGPRPWPRGATMQGLKRSQTLPERVRMGRLEGRGRRVGSARPRDRGVREPEDPTPSVGKARREVRSTDGTGVRELSRCRAPLATWALLDRLGEGVTDDTRGHVRE